MADFKKSYYQEIERRVERVREAERDCAELRGELGYHGRSRRERIRAAAEGSYESVTSFSVVPFVIMFATPFLALFKLVGLPVSAEYVSIALYSVCLLSLGLWFMLFMGMVCGVVPADSLLRRAKFIAGAGAGCAAILGYRWLTGDSMVLLDLSWWSVAYVAVAAWLVSLALWAVSIADSVRRGYEFDRVRRADLERKLRDLELFLEREYATDTVREAMLLDK